MADLPLVVLAKIFDFLSIPERLRMRQICKQWKFVIDDFNPIQSVCIVYSEFPCNERWCFSNQIVSGNEVHYLKRGLNDRSIDLRMQFFRNLQKVYLFYTEENVNMFLKEINQLTRLKVLMVEESKIGLRTLESTSLEKLSLYCHGLDSIELNTPNLTSLVLRNSKKRPVTFVFPLSIEHLKCVSLTSDMSQLKNLKTLVCDEITFDFRLSDFKCLTKLEIWPDERQLEVVEQIREQRNRLERTALQLVVSGFEGLKKLVSCERGEHNDYQRLTTGYLKQIERYRSNFVGCSAWRAKLEVNTLLQNLDRIPNELFEHFPGVDLIDPPFEQHAPDTLQENATRLMEIIKMSNTRYWCFRQDIQFLHQLARVESLKHLGIRAKRIKNFEFSCLFNLKNLQTILIGAESIPVEFICNAVRQLRFLSYFTLRVPCPPYEFFMCIYGVGLVNLVRAQEAFERPFYMHYRLTKERVEILSYSEEFKDVNDLVLEIQKIKENEIIKKLFVVL